MRTCVKDLIQELQRFQPESVIEFKGVVVKSQTCNECGCCVSKSEIICHRCGKRLNSPILLGEFERADQRGATVIIQIA